MSTLAVIILTYNEGRHLERCLRQLKGVASEVFVIDSFSTDDTAEIARTHGAVVLQHAFVNYAKQFQWALEHAPIGADWIMRLDADEIIEKDLANQIIQELPRLSREVVGINLKRKHIFMNRWIRHGGRYPLILLRIWRRDHGRIEDRWMDEHMVVWGGRTVTFEGGFADFNLNDLTFFIEKHNRYATREAVDVLNQRLQFMPQDEALYSQESSRQAVLKRMIKQQVYNKLPFQLSAFGYFLYRYFLQLGFLDGREGLIYHVLQGFWYRFLVGAKIEELSRGIAGVTGCRQIASKLSELTGLKLVQEASLCENEEQLSH